MQESCGSDCFSETQTMKEKVSWKIQKAYQPKKYRQASLIPNLFDVLINIDFYAKKNMVHWAGF